MNVAQARRGAAAGLVGAAAWAALEPVLERRLRSGVTDVRLLGTAVTRGPLWPAVGTALHLANGAVFGTAFALCGGHGTWQGVGAAQIENLALWPALLALDRAHPARRSGALPPLARNGRFLVQECSTHALFGAVLGLLVSGRGRPERA